MFRTSPAIQKLHQEKQASKMYHSAHTAASVYILMPMVANIPQLSFYLSQITTFQESPQKHTVAF